jgi:hypothetical protein
MSGNVSSKNHFLVVGEVKIQPKKKCGAENRKTHRLDSTLLRNILANNVAGSLALVADVEIAFLRRDDCHLERPAA